MLSKNIIGVESSYVFSISEVEGAKMCCEIVIFVDVFQDELPYFPRQRNELVFFSSFGIDGTSSYIDVLHLQ
jgi:hypothetical protein